MTSSQRVYQVVRIFLLWSLRRICVYVGRARDKATTQLVILFFARLPLHDLVAKQKQLSPVFLYLLALIVALWSDLRSVRVDRLELFQRYLNVLFWHLNVQVFCRDRVCFRVLQQQGWTVNIMLGAVLVEDSRPLDRDLLRNAVIHGVSQDHVVVIEHEILLDPRAIRPVNKLVCLENHLVDDGLDTSVFVDQVVQDLSEIRRIRHAQYLYRVERVVLSRNLAYLQSEQL